LCSGARAHPDRTAIFTHGRWIFAQTGPKDAQAPDLIYDARTGKEYWHIDAGTGEYAFSYSRREETSMDVFCLLKDWAALPWWNLAARKLVWRQEYPPIDPTLSPYSAWLADYHRLILARRSARDQRMKRRAPDLLPAACWPGAIRRPCAVDRPFLLRWTVFLGACGEK